MTLPIQVVNQDHDLDSAERRAGAALAELRWHWTLDETNPDRVTASEYARQVGRSLKVISTYARGHEEYVSLKRNDPDSDLTVSDAIKLAEMGEETATATAAVASAENISVSRAKDGRKDDIKRVKTAMRDHKDENPGATPEDLEAVAQRMAKNISVSREATKKSEDRANETVLPLYINLSGDLGKAHDALKAFANRAVAADLNILPIESRDHIETQLRKVIDLAADVVILFAGDLDPSDA